MPKKKVAVALSDWLVDEVDDFARRFDMSRSAVVQEATARYLRARRTEEEAKGYRREACEALEDMRAFAQERKRSEPGGAPSSLEQLRALRATGRGIG